MYVAVGVAVGRGLAGEVVPVNATVLPATLEIDAIRVFQLADAPGFPAVENVTRYEDEGTLTWQDEFDGVVYEGWGGDGPMGVEYWWDFYEVGHDNGARGKGTGRLNLCLQ